jgi:phosphotransferase system HPr-like phosphotransfer protein
MTIATKHGLHTRLNRLRAAGWKHFNIDQRGATLLLRIRKGEDESQCYETLRKFVLSGKGTAQERFDNRHRRVLVALRDMRNWLKDWETSNVE